jgi:hypothetical protein
VFKKKSSFRIIFNNTSHKQISRLSKELPLLLFTSRKQTKKQEIYVKHSILVLVDEEDHHIFVYLVNGVEHHFQQYFSYIVAVSFIVGGNRSTWRKPPTCRKSLTNFIT